MVLAPSGAARTWRYSDNGRVHYSRGRPRGDKGSLPAGLRDPEITVVHGRAGQGVTDTGILNWKKSRDPYACPLSWDHALQRNMLVHLKFIMKFLICTFVFV